MTYVEEYAYSCYLAEQDKGRAELDRYMNECLLIAEGKNNLDNISILNESIGDKFKAGIARIIEILSRLWGKFLETMNTIFLKDKDYLEKYKDVILKKKPAVEYEYTLYNYMDGQKKLLSTPVPNFNYNSMKDELNDAKKFDANHFSNVVVHANGDYKLEDLAKTIFRGGDTEVTKKSSALNMTDLWNFCYSYNTKIKDAIAKDSKNISLAGNEAMNQINKLEREGKIKSESVLSKGKYYSVVYERYITEGDAPTTTKEPEEKKSNGVEIKRVDGGDVNKTENKTNGVQTNPGKAYQGPTGDKDTNIGQDQVQGESAEQVTNRIKIYLNSCGAITTAKMQVSEEAYKAYMTIIKTHVRDLVGVKDSESKPADVANNQKEQGNKNGEVSKEDKDKIKNVDSHFKRLSDSKPVKAIKRLFKGKDKGNSQDVEHEQYIKECLDFLYYGGDEQ